MLSREVLRRQILIHVEDKNRLSFVLKLSSLSRSTARTHQRRTWSVSLLVHSSKQALKYTYDLDSLYITSISFNELRFKRFWPVLHLHLNMMFYKPSIAQPGVLTRLKKGS